MSIINLAARLLKVIHHVNDLVQDGDRDRRLLLARHNLRERFKDSETSKSDFMD